VHLDLNIPPRVEYGYKVKGTLQTLNLTNYQKKSTLVVLVYDKDFVLCFTKGVRLFSKCGALGFRPFQIKGERRRGGEEEVE
jgi:hypothetical protein